jgi:hypothetical protein
MNRALPEINSKLSSALQSLGDERRAAREAAYNAGMLASESEEDSSEDGSFLPFIINTKQDRPQQICMPYFRYNRPSAASFASLPQVIQRSSHRAETLKLVALSTPVFMPMSLPLTKSPKRRKKRKKKRKKRKRTISASLAAFRKFSQQYNFRYC